MNNNNSLASENRKNRKRKSPYEVNSKIEEQESSKINGNALFDDATATNSDIELVPAPNLSDFVPKEVIGVSVSRKPNEINHLKGTCCDYYFSFIISYSFRKNDSRF